MTSTNKREIGKLNIKKEFMGKLLVVFNYYLIFLKFNAIFNIKSFV